jgi:DNA-binding transcriptional ArsR family regulator
MHVQALDWGHPQAGQPLAKEYEMTIDWSSIGTVTGSERESAAEQLTGMLHNATQATVDQALAVLRDAGLTDVAAHMQNNRFRYHPKTLIATAAFTVLAPIEPDPALDNDDSYGW